MLEVSIGDEHLLLLSRYHSNVDTEFTQLKIVSSQTSEALGVINWFAVHPTSMNNTNRLISSDNKGLASIMMETKVNGKDNLIGKVRAHPA